MKLNLNIIQFNSIHDSIIQLNNEFIEVCLDGNGILLINFRKHIIEKKIINYFKTYSTLNILKNGLFIVSCCYDMDPNHKYYNNIDIELYKIENNNLKLIYIKNNHHYCPISSFVELKNGIILTSSYDQTIKKWMVIDNNKNI